MNAWYSWALLGIIFNAVLIWGLTPAPNGLGLFTGISTAGDECISTKILTNPADSKTYYVGQFTGTASDANTYYNNPTPHMNEWMNSTNPALQIVGTTINFFGQITQSFPFLTQFFNCNINIVGRLVHYGVPSFMAWLIQTLIYSSYMIGFIGIIKGFGILGGPV
jgi:hypothetical protein